MNELVIAKIDLAAHRVAPLFKQFGWTWVDKKPTYNDIYQHIYDLVKRVLETGTTYVSCGRITVRKIHDGMTDIIEISLELESIYEYELVDRD